MNAILAFFRFIVEAFVHVIASALVRWKCTLCGKTFMDYPEFALPYKRFVVNDIERLSAQYLENENQGYRKTVQYDKLSIGYEERQGRIDERVLSHTTLWRWISDLGGREKMLDQALHLIEQKAPESSTLREVLPVHPSKYRSEGRKSILQRAGRMLRVNRVFAHLFGHKIFPRFRTGACWP